MKALGPPAARFLVLFSLTAKVLTCVRGTCPIDTPPWPPHRPAGRTDPESSWRGYSGTQTPVAWSGEDHRLQKSQPPNLVESGLLGGGGRGMAYSEQLICFAWDFGFRTENSMSVNGMVGHPVMA